MTKQELIEKFYQNHKELSDYVDSLPDDKFTHLQNEKWTAGQQLSHVYLCLKPISQALTSKEFIENKFGRISRPTMDYNDVINIYNRTLKNGGKAPDKFVPQRVDMSDKAKLVQDLSELLTTIKNQISIYSDNDLDTLVLPHPLLGSLTINEMFYLMTQHATHHLRQTEINLGLNASR
jgi:hypothetical protein